MKKILSEFKAFALKGNVIDLAVAVVIGGAFGKIVSAVVADVIMPFVGRCALPDLHEGVLQHIVRRIAVAHDALGHAEQPARLAGVQGLQGGGIATGAGFHGGFVVEVSMGRRHGRAF
jgi:hypothetical protein